MTSQEHAALCQQFATMTMRMGVSALEFDDSWQRFRDVPFSIAQRALEEVIEGAPESKRTRLRLTWRPVYQAVERLYEDWRRAVGPQ